MTKILYAHCVKCRTSHIYKEKEKSFDWIIKKWGVIVEGNEIVTACPKCKEIGGENGMV